MKNALLISIVSLVTIVSFGCKKKTTTVDACADTICLNGGTCNDGSCSCPTGYMGADCGTQKTPTKITIKSIKLSKFPANNNGSNWDGLPATGQQVNPDLILKLGKAGTNIFTASELSNFSSLNYTWDNTNGFTPIDLTDVASQYSFDLIDKDTPPIDNDDTIGSLIFSVYSASNKFPAKIMVGTATDAVNLELTLEYTY